MPLRFNLLFIASVTGVLLIGGCKQEAEPASTNEQDTAVQKETAETTSEEKKTILFYGNSLTAGYGLEEQESFPARIQDRIDSLSLPYTVVNAGLSGETTSGGLQRLDWVLRQPVDIFALELGANDMLRGLPLQQTRSNLSEIIDEVQAKYPKATILLFEMLAAPNMGADYQRSFKEIYQELADEQDVQLVPFFLEGVAGNPNLLLPDGKHPNADGQVIVAENVWQELAPNL